MDNRPIGVFDSGLGGLTAVRELRRMLPSENIIYFGDTSRVPYGSRSRETILKYARQDIRFLRSFDLKAIVIACGTVSTTSLPALKAESDIPMLGVVEPACRRALAVTKNKKVGLIATAASVRSGAYEKILHELDRDVEGRQGHLAGDAPEVDLVDPDLEILDGVPSRGRGVVGGVVVEHIRPGSAEQAYLTSSCVWGYQVYYLDPCFEYLG